MTGDGWVQGLTAVGGESFSEVASSLSRFNDRPIC